MTKHNFGDDFVWGTSTAAYQIEGGHDLDGKIESIWDKFSHKKGKIKDNANGDIACNHYHRYEEDINIVKELNFNAYRFSLSWPRIFPYGKPNQKGIDFYDRIIDSCLERNISPWITLYHWDLPQHLEDKGGWTNRDIVGWFSEYVNFCTQQFGDRVKNWIILNEPQSFTIVGYFAGIHAPGRIGLNNFFAAVHHACLCQAEGGRIAKNNVKHGNIGTTFFGAQYDPFHTTEKNIQAAYNFDVLVNRLFVEPLLGLGYPIADLPVLSRLTKFIKSGDEKRLQFDFDFIGIQAYTREIVKYAAYIPFLKGLIVPAKNRSFEMITATGWEIYPDCIYTLLKKYSKYKGIRSLYVTESGVAFPDLLVNDSVNDAPRIRYFKNHLAWILKAKREGIKVDGFFVWSLMDNFEWAFGYHTRFGIVYIDFDTQKRIIKDSGYWFQSFLK
jgi:beta-glucosidase